MLSRKNFRVYLLSLTLILVGILIAIPPITVRSDYGNGTGPGGIGTTDGTSNLVLWLDAGSLPQNDGSQVSTWTDKSGYGNHANQFTGDNQPILRTSIMNGQPVVRFDGTQDYLVVTDNTLLDNTAGLSILAVANPSNLDLTSPRGLISKRYYYQVKASYSLFFHSGDYLWVDIDTDYNTPDDRFSTNPVAYLNGVTKIIEVIYDGSLTQSQRTKVYNDGNWIITAAETSASIPHYNENLTIGDLNQGYGDYFGGDIPEIIIFREALNLASRTLVENYLGAKYNLTVAINHYDGSIMGNGDFDLDVSGIGKEADGSNTVADSAGMIIGNLSYLTDNGDYLLFGHRIPFNNNTTDDLPTTGTWASAPNPQRWTRSWYIDVTDIAGNGGSVNITFDFSETKTSVAPDGPASNYRLLKRSGESGQFDDVGISASISGDRVIFNGVDVNQLGSNFTLGSLDSTTSPTAIKLLSFTASTLSPNTIVGIIFVLIGSVIMVSSRLLPKQKI